MRGLRATSNANRIWPATLPRQARKKHRVRREYRLDFLTFCEGVHKTGLSARQCSRCRLAGRDADSGVLE